MNHGGRINYAREENFDGSVYVKTKSDYQQNERRNYVLNFYDKTDRLMKEREKGKKIKTADFKAAENVLRLEVQCGYQMVRLLCKRLRIENSFGRLFRFNVAVAAEELVYSRVFGCGGEQDFYAYEAAKKRIPVKRDAAKEALAPSMTHARMLSPALSYRYSP